MYLWHINTHHAFIKKKDDRTLTALVILYEVSLGYSKIVLEIQNLAF